MDKKEKTMYKDYVEAVTPTHNLGIQMLKAFVTGGLICAAGQGLTDIFIEYFGMAKDMASTWCSLSLIFCIRYTYGNGLVPDVDKIRRCRHACSDYGICKFRGILSY